MSTKPLWIAAEAANATGGKSVGDWRVSGVSIDSRSVAKGDLFVAIEGPSNDGHAYVVDALGKGAAAAMIHRRPDRLAEDAPVLEVGETLDGLIALGKAARARGKARIVAVTGSAGKTSTKEALRHVLSPQGLTSASAASFNNHWGVPLSLARMHRDTAFGIFEIGMNHPGEISPLTRMVRPHVAIITNVESAHTEFFDSLEGVCDAKAEILEGLDEGGVAILNKDNRFFDRLSEAAARRPGVRRISFGLAGADVTTTDLSQDAEGSDVRAKVMGREIAYRIALPGRHWVLNSLAVLAAVDALGADVDETAAAFGSIAALEGRGRPHSVPCPGGSYTLVDESYNANPASMRAAIETLSRLNPADGGRRIAILGSMRELGPDSEALHIALADPLNEQGIDLVMAAGEMRVLLDHLPATIRGPAAETGEALADAAMGEIRPGDVVMVKGSNASRMGALVERLLKGHAEAEGAR